MPLSKAQQARQNRIDYVFEEYGDRLWDKFNSQEKSWPDVDSINDLVNCLAKADPTKAGKAMKWLAETYIRSGFRLEDVERVKQTLILYATHSKDLPEYQRGLSRYKSEAELWKSIESFVDQEPVISNREHDRRDKAKAYAESEIVYQGYEGTIAIPRSEFAAKWWGRGTRWCTAADKKNQYEYYAKQGDLFVIVMTDGEKFQAQMESQQFVDSSDKNVNLEYFLSQYSWLKDVKELYLCFASCKFSLLKESWLRLDKKQRLDLIKSNLRAIKYLENLTSEEKILAFSKNAFSIEDFIEKATPEERMTAIRQNGYVIHCFADNATLEERLEAIDSNPSSIQFFMKTATPEERIRSLRKNAYSIEYFINTATPEERMEAIKTNPYIISSFRKSYTSEERLEAIKYNWKAIKSLQEITKKEFLEILNQEVTIDEFLCFVDNDFIHSDSIWDIRNIISYVIDKELDLKEFFSEFDDQKTIKSIFEECKNRLNPSSRPI